MKTCISCKEEKDKSEFFKDAARKDGLLSTCKACKSTYHKQYYTENKKSVRHQQLEKRYGITGAEYEALFAKQGGVCKICELPDGDKNLSLSVDHCHSTGKVRGLLCTKCNRALGLFNDRPELLRKAAHYLG